MTSDGEGYMGTHLPKRERKLTIEGIIYYSFIFYGNNELDFHTFCVRIN